MTIRVTPLLNEEQQNSKRENDQQTDMAKALKLFSIKTCLILMTSLLILISVVILSSIWISCFSPTVSVISSQVRDAEFRQIVSYIKQTMNEVTMVLETAKVEIANQQPFSLDTNLEQLMFNLYKSEFLSFHSDLVLAVYLGEPFGWEGGMLMIGKDHMWFDIVRGVGLSMYPCKSINDLYCDRNRTNPLVTVPFTSNVVSETSLKRPGGSIFTLSYTDKSLPSITFLTLLTSYSNPVGSNNTYPYAFHFGYDMSVGTVSKYLTEATKKVAGSKAYTVELETGYIISSDVADAGVTSWDDKGKETRKTPLTFNDPETVIIAKIVNEAFPDPKKIECNSGTVLSGSMRYISMYRYCTSTNIDWLIVFSVPQWNYIGTMIIAIVIAILSGLLIIVFSIIIAVFTSLRIVKPFQNLITAFESVASMKLDNFSISTTRFKEVRVLQYHFMKMVASIEKYRSFIPAHLLSEMDDSEAAEIEQDDATSRSSISLAARSLHRGLSDKSARHSSMKSEMGQPQGKAAASHSSIERSHVRNRFALYLEKRKVSVACLRMEGLGQWISRLHHQDVVNVLSDVFEQISQVNKSSGGQAGPFENASLLIYFNAAKDQSDYLEKAISTAATLNTKLIQLKEKKWKNMEAFRNNHLMNQVTFRLASCVQEATCGNVGTKEAKSFTVLGSFSHNVETLLEKAREMEINVVISEPLKNVCNTYHTRLIDSQNICADETVGRPITDEDLNFNKVNIYEVGESLSIVSDEWMYELQQQEQKDRWKKYNEATRMYLENCFPEATLLFKEYLEKNPHDIPAKNFLRKCCEMVLEL